MAALHPLPFVKSFIICRELTISEIEPFKRYNHFSRGHTNQGFEPLKKSYYSIVELFKSLNNSGG